MDLSSLTPPTIDQITTPLLVLGLFITAGLLIILSGWRVSLLALLAQYVLVGLWLAKLYRPEILLLKALTGVVAVGMIYLVAAEAHWGAIRFPSRRPAPAPDDISMVDDEELFPAEPPSTLMGLGFRLAALILAAVAAYGLTINYPLSDLPLDVNLAFYWLCAAGLVCLMISRDVVYMGLGVLGLISGLDLFYVAIVDVPDVVILGLLAGMSLAAALVVARSADMAAAALERPALVAGEQQGEAS